MIQLVDIVSYGVAIPFSSLSPSHSNSTEVPRLSKMAVCEYLPLYWSGAVRTSQGTAISGSCKEKLLGLSNSVWVCCLQMRWIPRWGGLWMAFPSVSVPLFVPAFPFDRRNYGLILLR